MKSAILIGRNHLFNYLIIVQSNYYIIEIFNCFFLKKSIETKDDCMIVKIIKENCENFSRLANTCIKNNNKKT